MARRVSRWPTAGAGVASVALALAGCGVAYPVALVAGLAGGGGGGGGVTNEPPSTTVAAVTDRQKGAIEIPFEVRDAEGDPVAIAVEFAVGAGAFVAATPAAGQGDGTEGLSSSPNGVAHTFVWQADADLGSAAVADVRFRITPRDAATVGAPALSAPFIAGNDPPEVEILLADALQSGFVPVDLILADSTSDALSLSATATVLASGRVVPVTLVGSATSGLIAAPPAAGGRAVRLAWSSFDDLPQTLGLVRLALTADDGVDVGTAEVEVVLQNDDAPSVAIEPVARQDGPVDIQLQLSADIAPGTTRTDVRVLVRFEARPDAASAPIVLDNDPTTADPEPTLLTGGATPGVGLADLEAGLAASRTGVDHALRWDARADLAGLFASSPIAFVTVSLTPLVGTGSSTLTGLTQRQSFAVGATAPTLTIEPGLAGTVVGGVVPVAFTLADPAADLASVRFAFTETGSAAPPRALTLVTASGVLAGAGTSTLADGLATAIAPGVRHVVGWNTLADLGEVTRAVEITLVPASASTGTRIEGAPVSVAFTVANNAAPAVGIIAPAAGTLVDALTQPFVPVEVVLVDADGGPADLAADLDLGSGFVPLPGSPVRALPASAAGVRHLLGFSLAGLGRAGIDVPGARLRVTPSDAAGPGAAAEASFDLDGNRAPQLTATGPVVGGRPVAIVEGTASIQVRVLDAERDLAEVVIDLSRDNGVSFQPAPLPVSSPLDTGAAFHLLPLDTSGIATTSPETVIVRLTPRDGLGLPLAARNRLGRGRPALAVLQVDNARRPAPVIVPLPPSGVQRGPVSIPYRLIDAFGYLGDVEVTFAAPGRAPAAATAVAGPGSEPLLGRESSPTGVLHTFLWDTGVDLATENPGPVELTFRVTNRTPPGVVARTGTASTTVTIDNGLEADLVLGQPGFRTGSVTGRGLDTPTRALAASGRVWIADTRNNRVLQINGQLDVDFQAANVVLGQPSASTRGHGLGLGGLSQPQALAFDGQRLYVGGRGGRVWIWDTIPTATGQPADRAIDLPAPPGPGVFLSGLAADGPGGHLYASDASNHRVLRISIQTILDRTNAAPDRIAALANTPADIDRVIGQPNLASTQSGSGLERLFAPSDVALTPSSTPALVIADARNDRVVFHVDARAIATDGAPGDGAMTLPALSFPGSLYPAADGRLFVALLSVHRVAVFPGLGQPVAFSLGSGGSVASFDTFVGLSGVAGTAGRLLVVDGGAHRVLAIGEGSPPSLPTSAVIDPAGVRVFGQRDTNASGPNHGALSPFVMRRPGGVATDRTRLFVVDQDNARVMVWNTLPDSFNRGADLALGQPDLFTSEPDVTPSRLVLPVAVATDGRFVFVSDDPDAVNGPGRILIWDDPRTSGVAAKHVIPDSAAVSLAYDPVARILAAAEPNENRVVLWHGFDPAAASVPATPDAVIGQTSLALGGGPNALAADAAKLAGPRGVALVDGKLLISDTGNHRVLVFDAVPPAGSFGAAADRVAGKGSFAGLAGGPPPTRAGLRGSPTGLALGAGRLFVAESDFNRIVLWNGIPSAGARFDGQFGQPLFDGGQPNAGGLSKRSLFLSDPSAPPGLAAIADIGVALSAEHLWIADAANDRIVRVRVLGQGGFSDDGIPTELIAVSGADQTGVAGVALPAPLVVEVRDAEGTGVAGVLVSFAVRQGGGQVAPASALTDSRGRAQATFTLGGPAGANRVEAIAAGLGLPPAVFPASGVAGPPATLAKQDGDAQVGLAGALLPVPLRVRVADAFGNPAAGATVAFAVVSGGGSLSVSSAVTDGVGEATTAWTLGAALGVQSVRASVAGQAAILPVTFTATAVNAGSATRLVFVTQPPSTARTSDRFSVAVAVQDDLGNTIDAPVVVALGFEGGDPGAVVGAAQNPVLAVGGQALFTNVSISRPSATPYRLRATVAGGGLTAGVSDPITVQPGVPAKLAIVVQPAGAVAGAPFATQPRVRLLDAFDNLADPGVGATVDVAITPGAGAGATLQGTLTASFAAGVGGEAGFTDLRIDEAGGVALRFTASLAGVSPLDSAAFVVAPAAPERLVFDVPASQPTTDDALDLRVVVEDRFQNRIAAFAEPVLLDVDLDPVAAGGGGQPTTLTLVDTGSGFVLPSPPVRIQRPFGAHVVTARTDIAPGTPTSTPSAPFAVEVGRTAKLAVLGAPQTRKAGQVSGAIVVERRDQFDNPTTKNAAGTSNATLTVTAQSSAATGRFATSTAGPFAAAPLDVVIASASTTVTIFYRDTLVGAPTLTFVPPAPATAGDQAYVVEAGPPAKLAFVQQPQSVLAGEAQTVTVAMTDGFGNVTDGSATITLELEPNAADATLGQAPLRGDLLVLDDQPAGEDFVHRFELATGAPPFDIDEIVVADPAARGVFSIGALGGLQEPIGVTGPTAPFAPEDVAILGAGELLVLDRASARLLRVSPRTGQAIELSAGGLLTDPVAVTVGHDAAYVADGGTETIVRVDLRTGAQSAFSSQGQLAGGGLAGITFERGSNAGFLVVDEGLQKLVRLDLLGAQTLVSSAGSFVAPRAAAATDSAISFFLVDPLGPDGAGTLFEVNRTLGSQSVLATGDPLIDPVDVAADSAGSLVIADEGAPPDEVARILRITSAGVPSFVSSGGDLEAPRGIDVARFGHDFVPGGFGSHGTPRAVTIGPDGDVFVLWDGSRFIRRYDADTGFPGTIIGSAQLPPTPTGIAVDADGLLYVAVDTGASDDFVRVFDTATGAQVTTFFIGNRPGPSAIAFGPDGRLYVAFDGEVRAIERDGTNDAPFTALQATLVYSGLAFGPDGHLYVRAVNASTQAASVLRFDGATGAPLGAFVAEGSGGLEGQSSGIRFTTGGDLLVADQGTGTSAVLRFDGATGAFVETLVPAAGATSGDIELLDDVIDPRFVQQAVSGVATFPGVVVGPALAGYRLRASARFGLRTTTSSAPFSIEAGAAARLAFTTGSKSPPANTAGVFGIERRDAFDNPTTRDTAGGFGALDVTATSTSATGEFAAGIGGPFVAGPHAFTILAGASGASFAHRDRTAGLHTLTVSGVGVAPGTQLYDVRPAAPAQVVIVVQPDGATGGAPFATQPAVKIQDAFGNDAQPGSGRQVTASIASGAGTLQGTLSVAVPNSIGATATFTNLRIDEAGTFTLAFDSTTPTALTGATSDPFDVVGGVGGGGGNIDFLVVDVEPQAATNKIADVVVADLDRDGRDDLVLAAEAQTDVVAVVIEHGEASPFAPVPDGGTASSTIDTGVLVGSGRPFLLELGPLTITHPDASELRLRLTRETPVTETALLAEVGDAAPRPGYENATIADFAGPTLVGLAGAGPITGRLRPRGAFPLEALVAEPSQGRFRLDVFDQAGGASGGTLERWGLEVWSAFDIDTFGVPPVKVAAGDIDRDGVTDLVVARSVGINNHILVFQGGTSVLGQTITLTSVTELALGDLDGDGILDLVAAGNTALRVFAGQAATPPAFQVSPLLASRTAAGRIDDVALADVDRDGDLDVVIVHQEAGTAVAGLFLNDGAGALDAGRTIASDPSGGYSAVALADVDRDGFIDLGLTRAGPVSEVRVLRRNPAVAPPLFDFVDVPGSPYAMGGALLGDLVLEDLDRDGRLDATATVIVDTQPPAQEGGIAVLLGQASGDAFAAPQKLGLGGTSPRPTSLVALDLATRAGAHDGTLDIVTANSNGRLGVIRNTRPPLDLVYEDAPGSPIAVSGASRAELADIDRDGVLDLVILAPQSITVRLGNGDGSFTPSPTPIAQSFVSLSDLAIADLDRDGALDLAVVDRGAAAAQNVLVLLGDGTGAFSPAAVPSVAGQPQRVAVADLDRDGVLDLVTAAPAASDGLTVLQGSLAGGLSYTARGSGSAVPLTLIRGLAVADFDRDGRPDIAVADRPPIVGGQVVVWKGTGGADPSSFDVVATVIGVDPLSMEVSDLDRDGRPELTLITQTALAGAVVETLREPASGSATFGFAFALPTAGFTVQRATDLDRDGQPDLITAGLDAAGEAQAIIHRGPTFEGPPLALLSGLAGDLVGSVAVGDVDRDGGPDLVLVRSAEILVRRLRAPRKGVADQLAFASPPAVGELAGLEWAPFTVEVRDGFGSPVASTATIALELVSGTGALLGTTSTAAVAGLATFDAVRYEKAETIAFRATAPGLRPTAPFTLGVAHADAASLRFVSAVPATLAVREPIAAAGVGVEVTDAFGNRVTTGPDATRQLRLTTAAGAGLLLAGGGFVDPEVAAVDGLATFPADVAFATVGSGQALRAEAVSGAPPADVDAAVDVVPAAALTFALQPLDGVIDRRLAPVEVLVRDPSTGLPSVGVTVSLDLSGAVPGFGDLRGALEVESSAGGIAGFDDLSAPKPGAFRLLASANGGADTALSEPFTVGAPLVRFTVQPADGAAGVAFDPVIEVEVTDAGGNAVGNIPVRLALEPDLTGAPGALVGPTALVTGTGDGRASFGGLAPASPGRGFRLRAEADVNGDGAIDPARERAASFAFDVRAVFLEATRDVFFPAVDAFDGHGVRSLALGDLDQDGRLEAVAVGATPSGAPQAVVVDLLRALAVDPAEPPTLPLAIADDGATETTRGLFVPPSGFDERVGAVAVRLDVAHPNLSHLGITLDAPSGLGTVSAVLVPPGALSGDALTGTVLDDFGLLRIDQGATAPFAGRFRPPVRLITGNSFAGALDGAREGLWTLRIEDTVVGDQGQLLGFGLDLDTFEAFPFATTGADPAAVALADVVVGDFSLGLDRDGRIDVLVARTGGAGGAVDMPILAFAEGDGLGALTESTGVGSPIGAPPGAGTSATGGAAIAAGDFDRDGRADALLVDQSGLRVHVFRGTASGFAHHASLDLPAAVLGPPAVGDLDRDGIPDVAIAVVDAPGAANGAVLKLLGDGAGGFTASLEPGALGFESGPAAGLAVALADVDQDGDLDYVVSASAATNGACIVIEADAGVAVPGAEIRVDLPTSVFAFRVVAADLDKDARPEALLSATDAAVYVVRLPVGPGAERIPLAPASGFFSGAASNPGGLAVGDIDRDGSIDAVVAGFDQAFVTVLENPTPPYPVAFGGAGPAALAEDPEHLRLADLDRDGALDLVFAALDGAATPTIAVVRGNGAGGFPGAPVHLVLDAPSGAFALADFDRDGVIDLAAPRPGESFIDVFAGDGAGGFTLLDATPHDAPYSAVAAGDLDRDGFLDLVAVIPPDPSFPVVPTLHILQGEDDPGDADGSDRFDAGQLIGVVSGAPLNLLANDVALADLSGDGVLDVAACEVTGAAPRVLVLRGLGDGDVEVATPFASIALSTSTAALATSRLVAADLDGDGLTDLAVALAYGGAAAARVDLAFARRGPPRAFAGVDRTLPLPADPTSIAAADMNGDGALDLVVGLVDGRAAIFQGGVPATPGPSFPPFAGSPFPSGLATASALAVGDLDRNGRLDLASVSRDEDSVSVQRGGVAVGTASRLAFQAPPAPTVTAGSFWSSFSVRAIDDEGTLDASFSGPVTVVLRRGGSVLHGPLTVQATSGLATFSAAGAELRYFRAEDIQVVAASPGLAPTDVAAVSVTAGAASRLAFALPPRRREIQGVAWATFIVRAEDDAGNPVAAGGALDLSVVQTGGAGTLLTDPQLVGDEVELGGTSYDAADIVTFDVVDGPTGGTLAPIVGVSVQVTGAPVEMVVVGAPASVQAGATWPAFAAELRDAAGDTVPAAGDVSLLAFAPGGGPFLAVLATEPLDGDVGVARFASVTRSVAGAIDVVATPAVPLFPAVPPSAAVPVLVTAGPAARLAFEVAPAATERVGDPWSRVVVRVEDALGHLVTSPPVSVSLVRGTGTGALTGVEPRLTVAGLASFETVRYDRGETIEVRAIALGGGGIADSAPATVTVEGTRLAFAQAPRANETAGVPWQAVTVEVRDPFGQLVTTPAFDVAAVLVTGTGTLSGGEPVPTVNGIATFSALSYDAAEAIEVAFVHAAATPQLTPALASVAVGAPGGGAGLLRLAEQVRLHGAGTSVLADFGAAAGDLDGDGAVEVVALTSVDGQPEADLVVIDRVVGATPGGDGASHAVTLDAHPLGPVPVGAVVGSVVARVEQLDADPAPGGSGQTLDDLALTLLDPVDDPVTVFDPVGGDTGGATALADARFADLAAGEIAGAAAPVTGTFRSASPLVTPSGPFLGAGAAGTWTLEIDRTQPTDLGRFRLEVATVSTTAGVGPSGAVDVALGDLDGDGDLDAVAVGLDGGFLDAEIFLRERVAGGGFASRGSVLAGTGSPERVLLGDLDHDGRLDIVLVRALTQVEVFFNAGGFVFSSTPAGGGAAIAPFALAATQARQCALADVDGDGLLDLVHNDTAASTLGIVPGRPGGGFDAARAAQIALVDLGGGGPFPAEAFAVGDIDQDGRADLVVARNDATGGSVIGRLERYSRPLGSGGLDFSFAGVASAGGDLLSLVLGDLDKDGLLDAVCHRRAPLAGGGFDDGIALFLGEASSARFGAPQHVFLTDAAQVAAGSATILATPSNNPGALQVADWDQDGDLDVLVPANDFLNGIAVLDVLVNESAPIGIDLGGADEAQPSFDLLSAVSLVAGLDANQDGNGDLAFVDDEGRLRLARASGGLLSEDLLDAAAQLQVVDPTAPAGAVVAALGLDADAFVFQGLPDAAFGSEPDLVVLDSAGSGRKTYLRFFTAGAVSDLASVEEPTLRLRVTSVPSATTSYRVFGLDDGHPGEAWDESTITWNNAPANDTTTSGGVLSADATDLGTFTVDPASLANREGRVAIFRGVSGATEALRDFIRADTSGSITLILVGVGGDPLGLFAREVTVADHVFAPATVDIATGDFNRDGLPDVAVVDASAIATRLQADRPASISAAPLLEYRVDGPGVGVNVSSAQNTGTLGAAGDAVVVDNLGAAEALVAAVPFAVAGRGFRLEGPERLEVATTTIPYGRELTIEMLIRLDALPADPVAIYDHFTPSVGGVRLLLNGPQVVFEVVTDNGGPTTHSLPGVGVVARRFQHIAATYDGGQLRLYLDGLLLASSPEASLGQVRGRVLPPGAVTPRIGFPGSATDGIVAEVRVHPRALLGRDLHGGASGIFPGGAPPRPLLERGGQTLLPSATGSPVALAAAALDGDGRADLAVLRAGASASTIHVLRGRAGGVLVADATLGRAQPTFADDGVAIAAGDVDGDGLADLAVVTTGEQVILFRNQGGTGFAAAQSVGVPRPTDLALGDLDGDGRAEIWVAHVEGGAPSVSVFKVGAGAPFLLATVTVDPPSGGAPDRPGRIALADADRDGFLDAFVTFRSGGQGGVRLLRGGVAAPPDPPAPVLARFGAFASFSGTLGAADLGGGPEAIVLIDLDGDGDVDTVTANGVGATHLAVSRNDR